MALQRKNNPSGAIALRPTTMTARNVGPTDNRDEEDQQK